MIGNLIVIASINLYLPATYHLRYVLLNVWKWTGM